MGRVSVAVQLKRCAKGHTAIGRADVENVAGIAPGSVASINVIHYAVLGRRLSPALMPPVSRTIVHSCEIPRRATTGSWKDWAGVRVGPSRAAVRGLEKEVCVVVREAAAAFIHSSDVHIAVGYVAGDLHVADKGTLRADHD